MENQNNIFKLIANSDNIYCFYDPDIDNKYYIKKINKLNSKELQLLNKFKCRYCYKFSNIDDNCDRTITGELYKTCFKCRIMKK